MSSIFSELPEMIRTLHEDIATVRAALEAFAEPELQDTPFFVPARVGRPPTQA